MTLSISQRWWIVARPNPSAHFRLFCFPHAGGNASTSRSWHASLPSAVEVYGVQLPGRANRIGELALTRLADLVEGIGLAIRPLIDRPMVFFGHSMGALLSFELARWVRRHYGVQPIHLFVSGRRAPQLSELDKQTYLASDADFIAKLSGLNGTPSDLFRDSELFDLVLPTVRADFKAVETYRYLEEPPLDCPITVYGGTEDPESQHGRMEAWDTQTTVGCSTHIVRGGHFFVQSNERELLFLLNASLLQVIDSYSRTRPFIDQRL